MKVIGGLLLVLFVGLFATSCFDPPDFPVVPEIEFKRISFQDRPDPSDQDSLILELSFKDGDGDLGLNDPDSSCNYFGDQLRCYNSRFFFDQDFKKITTKPRGDIDTFNYRIKRTNPQFANLPDYKPPYSCTNWELKKAKQGINDLVVVDTLYIELNPDHHNIFVDFLVKQPDGNFQEFDFLTEYCQTYDARFPVLFNSVSLGKPMEGTIRYAMPGVGFLSQFSIKTLKLRVQIQDRALNKSNIIETPEFTLQSIKN